MSRSRPHLVLAMLLPLALAGRGSAAELRGIGIDVDGEAPPAPEVPLDERPLLRVRFDASLPPGARTFPAEAIAPLEAVLEAAQGRWRVIVLVAAADGSPRPNPREPAALEAWLSAVGGLADMAAKHDVAAWEIADEAAGSGSFDDDAFLFKKTAVALKAASPDAPVAWCVRGHGPGSPGDEARRPAAGQIEASGILPFIDAFALDGDDAGQESQALLAARGPAVPVWEHGLRRSAGIVAEQDGLIGTWTLMLDARTRGVAVATLGGVAREHFVALLPAFHQAFPADAEPVEAGSLVTFPAEAPLPAQALIVTSDLSHRVVFGPAPPGLRAKGAWVIAHVHDDATNLRLVDPLGKLVSAPQSSAEKGGLAVRLPLADRPLVLGWDRPESPEEVKETSAVAGEHEPTIDEILARHAEQRAIRAHRVTSWTADLTTTMRYQLGQSGRSIEVRIESRYFEDSAGLKEIENLRFFIDGAPYEPKKGQPPELPLIQPEKVTVVPLEIQLDKSYVYELRGKAQRAGRPTWKLAFRPVEAKSTAWSGIAWIDATTFDLVATDLDQAGLEPPVLSNRQLESYGAVQGPRGEAWLVDDIDIRRVLSLLGANVVVDMKMAFTHVVVDPEDFAGRLAEARGSEHQMLRDTDQGLLYLRKNEAGERVPVEASSRKLFFIAGLRYDESFSTGFIPLAGVNWLDHDAWGKGLQVNAFVAAAINDITISDPSLGGSKTSGTFEAFVPLIRQRDRVRRPAGVDDLTAVRVLEPRFSFGIGRPLGSVAQVGLEARVWYRWWSDTEDTDPAFEEPADGAAASLVGSLEIHQKGWDFLTSAERARRFGWDEWGPVDPVTGEPTIASPESYWKWRIGLGRTFRPAALQSLTIKADYFGGESLDRYAQYEFSSFGGPDLAGFDGTGIHFEQAAMLGIKWELSLLGRFGFDVHVGAAQTTNDDLPAADLALIGTTSTHVGVGIGGTFPGPWRTIVRFDVGVPAYSPDYDGVPGQVTAQLLFTKLLK